ncbi:hypothetical protein CBL_03718 [Carabus blaptoides fortunei]
MRAYFYANGVFRDADRRKNIEAADWPAKNIKYSKEPTNTQFSYMLLLMMSNTPNSNLIHSHRQVHGVYACETGLPTYSAKRSDFNDGLWHSNAPVRHVTGSSPDTIHSPSNKTSLTHS